MLTSRTSKITRGIQSKSFTEKIKLIKSHSILFHRVKSYNFYHLTMRSILDD